MTIKEAKEELEKYKFLNLMKEEAISKLAQLNADYSLINGQSTHVDGGERDFERVTLLDKIHIQQIKSAQYVYDMESQAYLIRSKLKQIKEPYGTLLLKRYLEFKPFRQIAREMHYAEKSSYDLHIKALDYYSKVS